MLKSKKLLKFTKINHGFFNRQGGFSKGIYSSLNCGIGSNDKKKNVLRNLKIVKDQICRKSKNIILAKQTHSNKFVFIIKKSKFDNKKKVVDAIITDKVNFPIAVLTADCVPILIYDSRRNMIAAIHAGWKGAFKGIIKNVLNFMYKNGCNSKNLIAAIGPCISHKNYEVQDDLREKFEKKDKRNKIFFKIKKRKLYFNLQKYVKTQLKLNKIRNIDLLNKDTYLKNNNYFSARQSIKLKQNDYGRNISIIVIN